MILRFLLLNECELSLKVLVLVINAVALAYTAAPLLRRRGVLRSRVLRRRSSGEMWIVIGMVCVGGFVDRCLAWFGSFWVWGGILGGIARVGFSHRESASPEPLQFQLLEPWTVDRERYTHRATPAKPKTQHETQRRHSPIFSKASSHGKERDRRLTQKKGGVGDGGVGG